MAGMGLFSLAPTYPSLDATPPFPGAVSGLPDLSGAKPYFPGPSTFVKTDGVHDEGDSRESITHHIALSLGDASSDLAVNTGVNHLIFLRTTPWDAPYRPSSKYQDLYPQYVPKTLSSLNYYLQSPEGRSEFGHMDDGQDILDHWRWIGVQLNSIPVHMRTIQDQIGTFIIAKRARTFNVWLASPNSINAGDSAWLLLRRYPWSLEKEHKSSYSSITSTKYTTKSSSLSSGAGEDDAIGRLLTKATDEGKEEKKIPSIILSDTLRTDRPTAADAQFYWQFDPYITHGNERVPLGLYSSDLYIGAAIRIGLVTDTFGRRDSPLLSHALVKKMVYPDDGTDKYKKDCPDLPEIEIMLRVK
jgi:hypothetical protein